MKNILKVRMLGGFTLEYKGKELVLDRNNVSKTTQLFQLLLLHTQDGGISKAALIDALYGRSDVENKNGSLNNTIFRLRKQLTAAGLPESSYININGGMCTWDPDIETSVDVCDFKQTIESARHEKSQKTKMEIYAKAWKLYTGEFLPDMMGGSRKHRMSRYVFRLCRRTVPLPENRRKIRRTLPCCTQRSRNLSILRLADMGNRQPHRNVPLQRRPRCLQKNNQADVRRTRPVTICRNARAIQTYGRANLSGSRRDRRHQVPPPRKRIHRRRLLLHLSKLRGRLPRVRPHDGTNRHVRIPDALHPGLYKYRGRRRKSEILFRTSPRVHPACSPQRRFLHPIQHPAVSRNADRDNPGKLYTRIKTNQHRIQQKTHPPQERINRLLRCLTR